MRSRLDSLTALRFVAAALVVGHHAWDWDRGDVPAMAEALFYQGPVGVSFFFVLSGFVLTWSRQDSDTPARFYRRRFARIYPAYLAVWLAAVAYRLLAGDGFDPESLAALTLLQAWVPVEGIYFSGLAVFWTLSCEAFFYAVFPFLIGRLARSASATLGRLLVALVAGHILIVIAVAASPIPQDVERWVTGFFPPFRLLEFVVGILLALLVRRGSWPRVPLGWAGVLLAGAYMVAGLVPFALMRTAITLVPLVLLIGAAAQRDLAGGSPLAVRWLIRLGIWSYALYLVHPLVLTVCHSVVPMRGGALSYADAAVCLGLAVAASALLYGLVEAPAERWLRGGERRAALAP